MLFLAALYVPLYQNYSANCVVQSSHRGTFLTRNINALAVNYAAGNGNAAISDGISDYNIRASRYCAKSFSASQEKFKNQSSIYDQLRAERQVSNDT